MSTVFFSDVVTGIVDYCVTHSLNNFKEGEVYEGKIATIKDLEPTIVVGRYYRNRNNDLVELPLRQNNYLIWNLEIEQWVEPEGYLQTIQSDGSKQTNQLASQKILSKYPIYKQLNLARTDTAQVMYDWIDNIRNLSNIANTNIETSTTLEQINSIVDNFKTELGNIA